MASTTPFLEALQQLLVDSIGWELRFTNHEEGGELEPFHWQSPEAFTPLNLIQSENWVQNIAVSEVFQRWLQPEQVGSVNGEAWLVPDSDPAQILLDSSTQAVRLQHYETLRQSLTTQLQNLSGLQFSSGSDYQLNLLIGQTADAWMAIAPLVPHATSIDQNSPLRLTPASSDAFTSTSTAPVSLDLSAQAILDRLGTIQLYGYYGGGYNQLHAYRLIQTVGRTQSEAIEQSLIQTELLAIAAFEALHPRGETQRYAIAQLDRLLQSLAQVRVYRFSFWNDEHFYIVGQTDTGDCQGLVLRSRFTYNP